VIRRGGVVLWWWGVREDVSFALGGGELSSDELAVEFNRILRRARAFPRDAWPWRVWDSCRQRRRRRRRTYRIQRASRVASAYHGVSFNTIRPAEGNCFVHRSLTETDGSLPAPMARNAYRSIIRKGARPSSSPYTILPGQGTVLARQLPRSIL
jgi:hypothetical protein